MKNLQRSLKIFIVLNYLRLLGFKFFIAKSEDDLKKVFLIRYQVYLNEGYIKKDICKDGYWKDAYDDYSINFLATNKKNEAVGAFRLTLNSEIGFPVENYFNLADLKIDKKSIAEPTRVVVKKEYRGNKRLVLFGLGAVAYRYCIKHNISFWYGTLPEKLVKSFKHFGIEYIPVSEGEPTEKNLLSRKEIEGYFNQKKLRPYLANLRQIK
jgi:hypothetical protein